MKFLFFYVKITSMNEIKLHNPTLRVINILNTIHEYENGLSFMELSKLTNIPKGTLYPIILTLVQEKILQNNNNNLSIGKKCFKIGSSYIHSLNFVDIVKPHMLQIVLACKEICQLGILDGKDVLYIEKTEPRQAIRLESYVGKTLIAYTTAIGKMILSDLNNVDVAKMYKDKFVKYTPKTVKNIDELLMQLDMIRKQGYAHEVGETNIDVECIAVPIYINNKVKSALSVSLPLFRSNSNKIEKIKYILNKHSKQISKELEILKFNL